MEVNNRLTPIPFNVEAADWYSGSRRMQWWHDLDVAATRTVPASSRVSRKFEDVRFACPALRTGKIFSPSI